METATLAGGCFWCTEAIFRRLKGVESVTSGYAGGSMDNPSYADVSTGQTGYAEAVQIKFDPKVLSYEKLLKIFWATHDPTTLNRQGADVGTQYRSAIFYHSDEQKRLAEQSRQNIKAAVTKIEPLGKFYAAEEYHQNFYENNKGFNPYCSIVIDPKIEKLVTRFNAEVKDEYQ
jgi:peptide-methionine (S)-S-oxide reductase